MSTPPEVALELERIRSEVRVGFTEQAGRLDLLIQRANQAEATTTEMKAEIRKLDERITPLERRQWPIPTVSALAAVAAVVAAVWPHVAH